MFLNYLISGACCCYINSFVVLYNKCIFVADPVLSWLWNFMGSLWQWRRERIERLNETYPLVEVWLEFYGVIKLLQGITCPPTVVSTRYSQSLLRVTPFLTFMRHSHSAVNTDYAHALGNLMWSLGAILWLDRIPCNETATYRKASFNLSIFAQPPT